jgi:hypothetical protein
MIIDAFIWLDDDTVYLEQLMPSSGSLITFLYVLCYCLVLKLTCTGWPLLTDLSCCPLMANLSRLSVPAILSFLSCSGFLSSEPWPGWPIQAYLSSWPLQTDLSWQSCPCLSSPGSPVLNALFHVRAVMFWLSCSLFLSNLICLGWLLGQPVQAYISQLFCPDHSAPAVLSWLSCHSFPALVVLYQLSRPLCHVLAILLSCLVQADVIQLTCLAELSRLTFLVGLSELSYPGCHAPAVMSWLSYQGCPISDVLSQLSCPIIFWQAGYLSCNGILPLLLSYYPLQLSCHGCIVS